MSVSLPPRQHTTDDPHGVLVQDVNRRLNELVQQQHATIAESQRQRANPPDTNGQAPELLDRVGRVSHAKLDAAEPVLRTLFDAFALTVTYDPDGKLATWKSPWTMARSPTSKRPLRPSLTRRRASWGSMWRARRDSNPQPSDP